MNASGTFLYTTTLQCTLKPMGKDWAIESHDCSYNSSKIQFRIRTLVLLLEEHIIQSFWIVTDRHGHSLENSRRVGLYFIVGENISWYFLASWICGVPTFLILMSITYVPQQRMQHAPPSTSMVLILHIKWPTTKKSDTKIMVIYVNQCTTQCIMEQRIIPVNKIACLIGCFAVSWFPAT
jgi:hypothetical protein